jgi:2-oxoglutarate ferredoxin oxidoreductase subunit beta
MIQENPPQQTNKAGLSRADYKGLPSTLCPGCGHNSVAAQIVNACYELNIIPEKIMKFSGIGCSSKSPTYFLNRSFSFNGVHGRMPSLALGASFADITMKSIGVSGDGDTASIGFSQFKHLLRRNLSMVYIVENNGVYALTKGQFSATSEKNLLLRRQGLNPFAPIDICMEAFISNATFVARSFAGDPKQLRELIKSALIHKGIAVLDVVSPCVTFHNQEASIYSYSGGKEHDIALHEISFVPPQKDVILENFKEGESREISLFDGSKIVLKKLDKDYDPTDRWQALNRLEEARNNGWLLTGLIFIDPSSPDLFSIYEMAEQPLNRTPNDELRPSRESIEEINSLLF